MKHILNLEHFNLDFDSFLDFKTISVCTKQKEPHLFTLITSFIKGDIAAYQEFKSKNADFFKTNSIYKI